MLNEQVAKGVLLGAVVSSQDAKDFYRLRDMFAPQIADFVEPDRKSGAVVAIIELGDRHNDSGKNAKRDLMHGGVGYRVVRWDSKAKPDKRRSFALYSRIHHLFAS